MIADALPADPWLLWYGCTRKVPYATRDEAERAARRRSGTRLRLSVYACPHRPRTSGIRSREHWHLTRRKEAAP